MTRVAVNDLQPVTNYKVQVRAVSDGEYSRWSESFTFTTTQNSTVPAAPGTVTWTVQGDGFFATWTEVTLDINSAAAVIDSYELELTASSVVKTIVVPAQRGQSGNWSLDFQGNSALWGTPQPNISLRVRAVNNKGIKGNWSGSINAQNPVPANVAGFTGVAGLNTVDLTWTANTDTDLDHYEVFVGGASGFTPTGGNRIFSGNVTHFSYFSTTYSAQYFKIRAVDKFNQASAVDTQAGPYTPTSPFTADVTAPATPTALAGTITNNANGLGAVSAMTWTMSSPPADLAGFNIRFRKVGATPYDYQSGIDSAARASTIILDTAYQNYEFQIQAYDFSGNQSAFSSTLTVTSPANATPATPTGLASVSDANSITYSWTGVADTDIKNYEVTFSTSPTFASGNITYLTGLSTTLTVSGLIPSTTYYARVRVNDTGGLSGSFTGTDTRATGTIPLSDGSPPASSPTPNVISELGWLLITWAPVANADTVTYEVHLSTSTGFTPSGATKVTEVTGTTAAIDTLPGTTTPLTYGTTYFVKLIAKDRDGSAAASAQGSGVTTKVVAADSSLVAADVGAYTTSATDTLLNGKNKVTWSASDPGATANLSGDVWFTMSAGLVSKQWQGTGGTSWTQVTLQDTVIASVAAGKITAGTISAVTIQVASTGSIQSTDYSAGSAGWKLSTGGLEVRSGVIAANTIISGTGIVNNLIVQSGGAVQSSNYSAGTAGYKISQLGIEMNDTGSAIKVEALRAGTIGGVSGSGVLNIAAGTGLKMNGGALYSNTYGGSTYNSGATAGFFIDDTHVHIPQGQINAAAFIGGTFSTGTITLSGGSITGGGWTLNSSGLTIPNGAINAAAVNIQTGANIVPIVYADFEAAAGFYTAGLVLFSGTAVVDLVDFRFNKQSLKWTQASTFNTVVLGTSNTDYNMSIPPGDYIISYYAMVKTGAAVQSIQPIVRYQTAGSNATVNGAVQSVPANSTWARYSTTVTVPGTATGMGQIYFFGTVAGVMYLDGIQVESKLTNSTTPSIWTPPGATTIIGDSIRTGSITSSAVAQVMKNVPTYDVNGNITGYETPTLVNDPDSRPAWTINASGAATFSNLSITGNVVVGDPTTINSTQNVGVFFNSTNLSPTIVGNPGSFFPSDVGQSFSGPNIPGGTTVLAYVSSSSLTLSANATATATLQGGTIVRPIKYTTQIASANYIQGSTGWMLRSDGFAEFLQLRANSISGDAIKANTLSADAITTGTITSDISLSGSFKTSIGYASIDVNTNSTTTVTTTLGQFYPDDVGVLLVAAGIPTGATIVSYTNATTVVISATATATASNVEGQIFRGRQVIIDGTGVHLLNAVGSVVTNLPTDPSTSAQFTGSITANSILVQDLFQMQGTNNILSANSQLTVSGGSYVPGSAPIVSFSYTKNHLTTGATNVNYSPSQDNFVNNPGGFFYDDTNKHYYFVNTYFGGSVKRIWAAGGSGGPVYQIDYDTYIANALSNPSNDAPCSVSADASNFFFLTLNSGSGVWKVQRISRTGMNKTNGPVAGDLVSNSVWDATPNNGISGTAAISVYGGNTYIAKINTVGKIVLYKYTGVANVATLAFASAKNDIVTGNVQSLQIGKFDMGGTNVYAVVTISGPNGGRSNYVYLVNTSSFDVTNLNFPLGDDKNPIGTTWLAATTDTSTGKFQSLSFDGTVYDYTALASTTTGTAIQATQAWRNDGTTGGTAGVGLIGPIGSYSMRRRAIMTIKTTQSIPNTGGSSPNSVAFLAGVDSGTRWRYPDPGVNVTSITATALQTSNSTSILPAGSSPGSPALVAGNPSTITNGGTAGLDLLTISGNGILTVPTLIKSGTVTVVYTVANTNVTTAVTFANAFPAAGPVPKVMLTMDAVINATATLRISTSSVTRSGFNIEHTRSTANNTVVNWLAVAQ